MTLFEIYCEGPWNAWLRTSAGNNVLQGALMIAEAFAKPGRSEYLEESLFVAAEHLSHVYNRSV